MLVAINLFTSIFQNSRVLVWDGTLKQDPISFTPGNSEPAYSLLVCFINYCYLYAEILQTVKSSLLRGTNFHGFRDWLGS